MFNIVGCNHGIQVGTGGFADFDNVDQNEQRTHFRQMLEDICDEAEIHLVLEENGGPEEMAAKQIADKRGIPWYDVNTTNEDKDRLGIPHDYVNGNYSDEQRSEWHRQREQIMVQKIKHHAQECESVLIVCGFYHMFPIAELLEQDGVAVQQIDYRERAWHRAGIFCEG
ncbi:MAG: hypothetical protein WAL55_05240 [Candidatus Acidiferrales bacterium]